jgi:hypothetical protein
MGQTLRMKTQVLAGSRIELIAPGLPEGATVDITIEANPALIPPENARGGEQSLLDFLESLPPSDRTLEEWAEFDRQFRRERDEWDR